MKSISQKSIYSNISYSFLQAVLAAFITILVNSIIARKLGVNGFGIFSLGVSIVSTFAIFTALGLRSITVRELAHIQTNEQKSYIFFSDIIRLRSLLSIATVLLIFLFLKLMGYSNTTQIAVLILSLSLLFDTISTADRDFFQARERLDFVAVVDITVRISSAFFSLIFLYFDFDVYAVMFSHLLASIFTLIVSRFYYYKITTIHHNIYTIRRSIQWKLLKQALPFFLTGFLASLYIRMDIMVISKVLSEDAVGLYSAPGNIISRLNVLPDAFASALFPVFVRMQRDGKSVKTLFESYLTYIVVLGLLVSCSLFYFSELIIGVIFGSKFSESVFIMKILSTYLPFIFISQLYSSLLQTYHQEVYIMKCAWVTLVINLALSIFLIKTMGIAGAAFATLTSQVIYTTLLHMMLIRNKIIKIINFHSIKIISLIFLSTGSNILSMYGQQKYNIYYFFLSLAIILTFSFTIKLIRINDITKLLHKLTKKN